MACDRWFDLEEEIQKDIPGFNIELTIEQALEFIVAKASGYISQDGEVEMNETTIWFLNTYKANVSSIIRKVL